jgi:glucose dehydrogenase/mono/diheme cytochrome c family protein
MWTEPKQPEAKKSLKYRVSLATLTVIAWSGLRATAFAAPAQKKTQQDWPVYGGESSGDRYSPLRQINRTNVSQLRVAWKLDVGTEGGLQTNPLVVGRTLFIYTPSQKMVALDGASGKQLWAFDAGIPAPQPNRGFSYWTDGKDSRLFAGVMNYLYALDPHTGRLLTNFGDGGRIDLRKDLGAGDYTKNFAVLTTPGTIYKDMIIVGFRAPETQPAPHGDIRAYDVHTGKLRWTFHTIPYPGEFGYETWPKDAWKVTGAANNWTGMVVDERRGIIFIPTGSAVTDFYGADRIGDDLFANTLLALDANTGKRIWHFQGVHHDTWDRDFPSPPALLTVKRNGKMVDAVAQTTKHGFVFLFERATGKPLFPIEERPFPASNVPGEISSKTQPIPLSPAPYARQLLTADMLTERTPEAHEWAAEQFKTFRSEGQFIPLGIGRQTVVFPGFDGGAEWGGPAVDPRKGVIYINSNDIPWTGGLAENKVGGSLGSSLYQSQCALCHGADLKGSPPEFPALVGIDKRMASPAILELIHSGKGRMPSFPNLRGTGLQALLNYVRTGGESPGAQTVNSVAMKKPISAAAAGAARDALGAKVYEHNCAICHGDDLTGAPSNYPPVAGVRGRLADEQIIDIVHNGKGRMPSFKHMPKEDTAALLHFLGASNTYLTATVSADPVEVSSKTEAISFYGRADDEPKYRFTGYRKFLDPDGYPAVIPPWGTLNAIDLNTGQYLWKIPLGQYPELAAKGMKDTGSENYGGPIVTAGGLVIIGATIYDCKIRAFNSDTGELLWQNELPFAGTATPATYMIDGKQYIVIATSGQRNRKGPQGAAYVVFALP